MEEQFDEALGGRETVPQKLDLFKFANARYREIVALNKTLEQAEKGGLIFQRLPVAMRRRVMAHHSKRMPRRLQEAHSKQLEKNGANQKTKCPSRKHRRRPQNILQEFNRRQRNFVWLETHLWHAKRFFMTEKWGYKLAQSPYAKVFRACYRASANHCLLQDISFLCCIEINGPENKILEGLNLHVNTVVGLTFGAKAFLSGCREGQVTLFHKNTFPFGCIGTVNFLWKADENLTSASHRTLWIWAHPAYYVEIKDCLVETFDLREEELPKEVFSEALTNCSNLKEEKKLETHGIFDPVPLYVNKENNISIMMLKDKLNRFRLTGPLSQSVLVDALNVTSMLQETCVSDVPQNEVETIGSIYEVDVTDRINVPENKINKTKSSINSKAWWKSYYMCSENNRQSFHAQNMFWTSLKGIYSPAQLPPHQIVALTVLDPRYQLPAKRTKIVPDSSSVPDINVYKDIPEKVSYSPIWNQEVRLLTTKSKLSNSELEKQRSKTFLVPGFSEAEIKRAKNISLNISNDATTSYIPLLLIQRPGNQNSTTKRLGFSSGWDIIIPAGWALPFWLALIFRGARSGGLKEAATADFEAYTEPFAPDTAGGKMEDEANKQNRKEQYFRLPPNKRSNFIKLGIASPFSCCWNVLLKDWCQNKLTEDLSAPFYVLRDRIKLNALKSVINSNKSGSYVNGSNRSDQISQFSNLFSNMNHNCLIPVRVECLNKGCPEDCAIICIPNADDFMHLKENPKVQGPQEQVHSDDNTKIRKVLREDHQKELKRLRKRRVQQNNKLKKQMDSLLENGESISHLISIKRDKMPTKDIVEKYTQKIEQLWVPEVDTIKDSCSRSIVGFICKGDFSFTEACGIGLGYIPLPAMIHLISIWTDKPVVLFRNPNSSQYYFALLRIC